MLTVLSADVTEDAVMSERDGTRAAEQAVSDAGRIEAAAAMLERRYPAARPDVLDVTISELHSIARAWRRMAASDTRSPQGPAAGSAPDDTSRVSATGPERSRPRAGASLSEGWAEVAAERSRAQNAERRLADITANLRLLAEGCRELASNGRDLDRNCTASAAYQDVASDILAIIGTEGENREH
jgi:hypothetical protein